MEINLYNPQQAHTELRNLWDKLKPALISGQQYKITLKQMTRSLPQNAMYHAIINQVAKQAQHMGAHWDADSWKRFLVDQWSQDTKHESSRVVPSLDGKRIVQLGRQTREFTKDEASEFTDWLLAWCVDNGVEIAEQTDQQAT